VPPHPFLGRTLIVLILAQIFRCNNTAQALNVINMRFFPFAYKEIKARRNRIEYNQVELFSSEKRSGQGKN